MEAIIHQKIKFASRTSDSHTYLQPIKISELQFNYEENNLHEKRDKKILSGDLKLKDNLNMRKNLKNIAHISSNKLKSIENIIELSIENFKNKIFKKKGKNKRYNEISNFEDDKNLLESDKNKRISKDIESIKSGSPVLWLKSHRKKQNENQTKLENNFQLKESETPILSNKKLTELDKMSTFQFSIEKENNIPFIEIVEDNEIHTNTKTEDKEILNSTNMIQGIRLKWKYGELIAEGTSAILYKAFNVQNGSIFVVKKFHCPFECSKSNPFLNEINYYKKFDHCNIIKCIDYEIINNVLLIYLEYASGGSVKNLIEKYGPLSEKLIKKYLIQILYGLKYIHEQGVVHRDIKAANVLVDSNGIIKLSDFGCSGQITLSQNKSHNELLDSLKGTLPWMAPEVICQAKYGSKADIWSLGCLLIEMKTGSNPWGSFDNYAQALFKIGKSNSIPQLPEGISDKFEDFLHLCLQRNPEERADANVLIKHIFLN